MAVTTKEEWIYKSGGMDLEASLFCGQSFSWQPAPAGGFTGVAGGRAAWLCQRGDLLFLRHPAGRRINEADAAFWRHYLALDGPDYAALLAKFEGHKKLAACVACNPGIRVLRQPFFETLLCFIISQNNHIPRITGIAARLREMFGAPLAPGLYSYPSPAQLAACTLEELGPLRAGFRAKYLLDAARKVAGGQVDEAVLQTLSDEDARRMLMQIHGVGIKVADCVLLYSQARNHIVPMDVWMKRAMARLFPRGMPRVAKGCEGIAQQYIFCWARAHLEAAPAKGDKTNRKN